MPEVVTCPHCGRKARVPDALIGKKVKCPGCAKAFMGDVSTPGARGTAPPAEEGPRPKPSRGKVEETGYEIVEEPARLRRPSKEEPAYEEVEEPPRRRRPLKEEEEEEEERPRRSRSGRSEEEEEEDDERPRRRGRDEEEDEDYDDRPRKQRDRGYRKSADWPRIYRGLTLHLWSVIIPIVAYLIFVAGTACIGGAMVGSLAAGGRSGRGGLAAGAGGIHVLLGLYIVSLLVSYVLRIIGQVYCLASPDKRNARTLALVTLILIVAGLVANLLGQSMAFMEAGMAGLSQASSIGTSGVQAVFGILNALLVFGGMITFLLYLRAIALILGDQGLARGVMTYLYSLVGSLAGFLILGVVFFLFIVGAGSLFASGGSQGPGQIQSAFGAIGILGMFGVCIGVLVLLGMLVWYIILLTQVRAAVGRRN